MYAHVGSRTTRERNARGEGIGVYRVDAATGQLHRVQVIGDLVNPLPSSRSTARAARVATRCTWRWTRASATWSSPTT